MNLTPDESGPAVDEMGLLSPIYEVMAETICELMAVSRVSTFIQPSAVNQICTGKHNVADLHHLHQTLQ